MGFQPLEQEEWMKYREHITNKLYAAECSHYSAMALGSLSAATINRLVLKLKGYRMVKDAVKKVIFNDPATIVLWEDGTKTVVKCQPGDTYDKEKGLLLCYVKHVMDDSSRSLNDFLREWVTE